MEDVEIWPKNAPCIANMMIEALAQHDCQQRETRDCQEYQQQLDSTDLPGVTFLPPRTADQDVTTELDPTLLEGVVGAMAALEPSNSTMASEPSESTAPILEKKKITLDKYNHHKALKLQQTVASPNLDENGERLDYDDFEPDDDPDNIQIDYQMPAPSPAPSPQTSIPPLEDAPMPMSLATTQLQVSTGPGSVPSAMEHTPTVVNRAPGFGMGIASVKNNANMSGSAAGFNITHASRDTTLFVFTTTNVFPSLADNTNASSITMPDNNGNADFHFDDADEAVDANILIWGGLQPHVNRWGWTPPRGYITVFTMAGGKPAEHSDTGGVDRGSSEDDGHPQVPRQLRPTVHLWISTSHIMGMDPSQSSSQLLYTASARHSVSSRVLQSHQQFWYCHSGAPPGLNTATTGRSPHSPPRSRDRSSSDQYGVPWTGLKG